MAAALPAFYYPSTIGWIDDNKLFLSTMSALFQSDYAIKLFRQTDDCLRYFAAYTPPSTNITALRGCIEHEHFETSNHTLVDFDVTTLNQVHDDHERSDEISVLIVDFKMPGMNGIELCQKLNGLPCKKILLTGEADNHAAIAAFNEKIIDCFIRKDSKTLHADLQKHIHLLTQQYFRERTQHLVSHLEASNSIALSDPAFAAFFNQFLQAQSISEYSIMDKNGSLFMLNKHNKASCLIVHTDQSLDAFVDTYTHCAGTAPSLHAIKHRTKIPFFGMECEPWERDVNEWEQCLYTPQILDGRVRYYWCVVDGVRGEV